jgi:arginase
VPFMAGDATHPVAAAPDQYARAGAHSLLAGMGVTATHQRIQAPSGGGAGVAAASLAVNHGVRAAVQAAISTARLPIVLAGSCDAAIGVVAGLGRGRCGIVWIDAHADFNTPASSASGFFPGMSLAVVTGHCYRELWASLGGRPPVPEQLVVLAGVRSLSPPAEVRRLQHSAIQAIPWRQGRPQGDVVAVLERLVGQVDGVYLHIDNDAFDPHTAPGIVDEPVPGGLSLAQMEDLIRAVTARLPVVAATIATYTPNRDQQDRTLLADLRVIELLGKYAAQH